MTTLPLSEVKARLSQIADEVHRTHGRITVTRYGRPYVVLMSVEELESIEATMELLADPDAMRRVEQARKDLDSGRVTSAAEMAALMPGRRKSRGA